MAKRKAFLKIVKENGPLVLDGAFGTELERHGCNIHDELWSSKMLIENPEIIKKVHIS
ncbi:MAG: homocysteine S-methyltransferase family protein, partial [Veillonella sp.]|nr:homocysteine S-methyltransferase family protein [Veillonella sp.]